ncbi:DUF2946 family protein [Azospirillum humicireducens]|uniref:DUF2946 family protein n=1 Tax=Azospirillum humicireducens TaxID=1226968 RepID=UPI001F210833|nr:DUF2946 family protein [Azospirillum humicireducens]
MPRPRPLIDRIRRVGLLAGALAFVLQMMVWSMAMPAMAMGGAPAGAEAVTICSVDGFKTVFIGSDGQPVAPEDGSGGAAKDHCPLCPTVTGAGLPPQVQTAVPAESMAMADARTLPGEVIAAGWFLSSLQARAPPAAG